MIGDIFQEVVKQLGSGEMKGLLGLPTGTGGWVGWGPSMGTNFQAMSKEGYEKNALVYACINELASSASEARLVVEQKRGKEWVPAPDHGLQVLLDNPNPMMSAYEFHFNTILMLSLCGECFWEMEPSKAGRIVGLWPMRPDLVEVVAERVKFGERTRRKIAAFRWLGADGSLTLPPDRVLFFKHPHPRDELRGLSPMGASAREIDTDNLASAFVGSFFKNAAIPFGVFKVKGHIDESMVQATIDKLKAMYGSVEMRWHDPLILGDDAEWEQLGSTFQDMDFPDLRRITETRICAPFQVPPILIGAFVGLEKGSLGTPAYTMARKSFWLETLIPGYKKRAGIINRQLAPHFGRDVRVVWDFSEVEALQEEKDAKWKRANEGFAAGMITRNMALEEIGKEPIPGHDIFLQPMMMISIPAGKKPPSPAEKAYLRTKSVEIPEEWKELWVKAVDMVAQAWEGIFSKTARELFGKEKEGLLKILRKEGKAAKAGTPFYTFLEAGTAYLVASKADWTEEFTPLFAGLVTAQADNILAAYGISFDINQPEVQKFLKNYTFKFAKTIEDVSEKALREVIMTAQSEGWSVPTTRNSIMELWDGFDKNRAETIARTETIRSSNHGAVEAWAQAGVEKKEWYTTRDGRQCGFCDAMHKKVVSIRSNFVELGSQVSIKDKEGKTRTMSVDYQDVYAGSLHPKCRCGILAYFE